MQNDNEKKKIKKPSGIRTNFAFQAAVLAGAGILSRVIGLLYRSPLFQIIGDEGNGYYGTAFQQRFLRSFQGSWLWENIEMRDGYLNALLSM